MTYSGKSILQVSGDEKKFRLWDFFSIILGLGGYALAGWFAFIAAKSSTEAQSVQFGFLAVITSTSIGAIIFSYYQTVRAHQERRELEINFQTKEVERNTALAFSEQKKDEAIKRSRKLLEGQLIVAKRFDNLQSAALGLSSVVEGYVVATRPENAKNIDHLVVTEWNMVSAAWDRILAAACETAKVAIALQKGRSIDVCSANIKLIVEHGVCQVAAHSTGRDPERNDLNDRKRREITRNAMYCKLVSEGGPLIVKTIDEFIALAELAPRLFDFPTREHRENYLSCLIIGVCIDGPLVNADPEMRKLIAIFCVDSKEENFFTGGYQTLVMRQLANQITACYLMYKRAAAARDELKRGLPVI